MGLRFRKSVKIAPGVRLNLNKNSTSVSFGGKGAHYTVSSNGRRTASVGIPGTGISYSASTSSGKGGKARDTAKSSGGSSSGRGDNDKKRLPLVAAGYRTPADSSDLLAVDHGHVQAQQESPRRHYSSNVGRAYHPRDCWRQ